MPTNYDPDKHARHSIRLREYDYAQSGAYCVTICIHQRECLLGHVVKGDMVRNKCGDIVQACWNELPAHFSNIALDAFVVMPNHVHGIIRIVGAGLRDRPDSQSDVGAGLALPNPGRPSNWGTGSGAPTLWDIIRAFKSISAIRVNRLLCRRGQPLWQRNYYEHIIRNEDALNRAREYIALNPLRWQMDQENPENQT